MRARASNSGYTILEVLIATVITGAMLGVTAKTMLISQQALVVATVEADLQSQALVVCDEIANDLKDAIRGTLTVPGTSQEKSKWANGEIYSSTISFQKCAGYGMVDGVEKILAGPTVTYSLETDTTREPTRYLIRRTEAGVGVREMSDRATSIGLQFQLDFGTDDLLNLSVQLQNDFVTTTGRARGVWTGHSGDEGFFIVRGTKVRLIF